MLPHINTEPALLTQSYKSLHVLLFYFLARNHELSVSMDMVGWVAPLVCAADSRAPSIDFFVQF